MNFLEAVAEMRNGRKVRRKEWPDKKCFDYVNNQYNSHETIKSEASCLGISNATYSLGDFEATDWEVVEEVKKTLSDKRINPSGDISTAKYKEDDIKEAINELRVWLKTPQIFKIDEDPKEHIDLRFEKKLKEIFGERFV